MNTPGQGETLSRQPLGNLKFSSGNTMTSRYFFNATHIDLSEWHYHSIDDVSDIL